MIYQRHIPNEELFSAQLEMLMQNSRLAMASIHLIGVFATVAMFWAYVDFNVVLQFVKQMRLPNACLTRQKDDLAFS